VIHPTSPFEERAMQALDVMTEEVVCIDVRESAFDAAELLLSSRVSALPVWMTTAPSSGS
jgi:CBS domain-containing protein